MMQILVLLKRTPSRLISQATVEKIPELKWYDQISLITEKLEDDEDIEVPEGANGCYSYKDLLLYNDTDTP